MQCSYNVHAVFMQCCNLTQWCALNRATISWLWRRCRVRRPRSLHRRLPPPPLMEKEGEEAVVGERWRRESKEKERVQQSVQSDRHRQRRRSHSSLRRSNGKAKSKSLSMALCSLSRALSLFVQRSRYGSLFSLFSRLALSLALSRLIRRPTY